MIKPSWDNYFLNIAGVVATRSNCLRRQVGAIIVKDKRIISTGFNGTPKGIINCSDGGCERCADTSIQSNSSLDSCICVHAEANAICQAALYGITAADSTVYITHMPCLGCAKLIINSGLKSVIFSFSYGDNKSRELLQQAKVKVLAWAGD